jgi:hypothetical protein
VYQERQGTSSFNKSGDLDRGLRDKDLSIRGRDQRLRKNRLVSNGDQFLVTTLDAQVTFGQNDDVGDDVTIPGTCRGAKKEQETKERCK